MSADTEYSAKEVAAHRGREDAWMAINGEVYDLTSYLDEHPGGAEILIEATGTDATEAFDNAGHSEDALEIMAGYRVGTLRGAARSSASRPVRVALPPPPALPKQMGGTSASTAVGGAVVSLGALAGAALGLRSLRRVDAPALSRLLRLRRAGGGLGFVEGFVVASALALVAGGVAVRRLSRLLDLEAGALHHAPHKKIPRVARPDPLSQRGFLDPHAFQPLPLAEKQLVAPNVYRLVFELPAPDAVLGLPTGQHVAIRATVGGATVQRSYTPVSNNSDRGVLELVVKVYDGGQLTGGYLRHLSPGDEVMFRGPRGAMRYTRGLCGSIGMLAGGTGITPMYQLIRAICEDERDTTRVSLIYANRTEDDMLLRAELEAFARRYPANLSLFYLLDHPPEGWAYGTGYVTKELMAERFPDPGEGGSRAMLCGPPGMVSAAKKALAELGYEMPGASPKITDQVFCF